jgi:ribosome-associated protein
MCDPILKGRDFYPEFVFSASRSSGAGGQNVNKVNTKVELRFSVASSQLLSDEEKQIISTRLSTKISLEGDLIVVSQTERSQLKNKENTIDKFYRLLEKALTPRKKRRPTQPTKASKEKRLEGKRVKSDVKTSRKKPGLE